MKWLQLARARVASTRNLALEPRASVTGSSVSVGGEESFRLRSRARKPPDRASSCNTFAINRVTRPMPLFAADADSAARRIEAFELTSSPSLVSPIRRSIPPVHPGTPIGNAGRSACRLR